MDKERRRLLAGGLTAGAVLPAAAILGHATAGASPPFGIVSFAWALGSEQSIPDNTWTRISWINVYDDNDDYFSRSDAAEIRLVQGGLYSLIAEVAWASNSTGIRQIQIVQDWVNGPESSAVGGGLGPQPTAVGTTAPGLRLPSGHLQHQQVTLQAGGNGSCWVEVYQNSGSTLVCHSAGATAPLAMIARYGPIS